MTTGELLQKILIACSERHIDFDLSQDGKKIDIKFYKKVPMKLVLKIPDFEDKNLPKILSKWYEKIKTISS